MVSYEITIFKLNYDGTFDEIAYENIKDVFTIVNILAIYIEKKKIMYIWTGLNTTQALKNLISEIRVLVKEEFPQFRILRNITIEMKSEPSEFFDNLRLTKEELYEQIDAQEIAVLPVLAKIEGLKKQSEEFIEAEEYKKAIETLKEIIMLSREIEDEALETEQKRLISELTEKHINKKIVEEIREETKNVEKEFYSLIEAEDILGAHNSIKSFKQKYEIVYDLTLIYEAKEIILRDRDIWKVEQERLLQILLPLEKDFNSSLKSMNIHKAKEIVDKGKQIANSMDDEKITKKWQDFEDEILETNKKTEVIEMVENFIKNSSKLKEKHSFTEIKSKLFELIDQVKNVDLHEHLEKLNMLKAEIEDYEASYNKTLGNIKDLNEDIKDDWQNARLDNILEKYEKILEFVRAIKNFEVSEKTSNTQVLSEIEAENRKRKEIIEKVENLMEESSRLKNTHDFDILKSRLDDIITQIRDVHLPEYQKKIENLKKEVLDAEELYERSSEELLKLIESFEDNIKDQQLEGTIQDCKNIIKIAELIGENEILEKFSGILEQISKEFEDKKATELKINEQLSNLEENIHSLLSSMDIAAASKNLEKGKHILNELDDDEVLKRWDALENKILETKRKDELIKLADVLMKESSDLKEITDLSDLKTVLDDLLNQMKNFDLPEYLEKLKKLKVEIEAAEKQRALEKSRQRLIEELETLEESLNIALKNMELTKAEDQVAEAKNILEILADNELNNKWNKLNEKINNFEMLVEKIKSLSKEGIDMLINDSFTKSLECFEQITNILEDFVKNHVGG